MKKIFAILSLILVLSSCDDTEPARFGGEQTLVYFPQSTANLDVVIDDVGELQLQINTTTLSDSDRTVTVEIVNEDLDGDGNPETTVDPENFDLPSNTATIPAGEFFGFITIKGIDNSVETTPELLVLRITDAQGAIINDAPVEVRVRQICPIPEGSFTGPYLLEQTTPIHPANGVPSFETQVVDVFQNGGSTERAFTAVWLEGAGIGQPPSTIPFDLSCNNILVTSDSIGTGLTCGDGPITLGSASQTGNYDPTDDSSFTLIISEYILDGGCGVAPPLVTEFNLTKQ